MESLPSKVASWKFLPTLAAGAIALALLYGGYKSLTTSQTVHIASGTPGGGYQGSVVAVVRGQNRDSH